MLSYHKSLVVLLLLCLSWALALYVAHHDGKGLAGPPSLYASAFPVSQLLQPQIPDEHQQQLRPSTEMTVQSGFLASRGPHTPTVESKMKCCSLQLILNY